MSFFIGSPEGRSPGHDELAKEIAENARTFALEFWRWEDMQAYMFRLLLECASSSSCDDMLIEQVRPACRTGPRGRFVSQILHLDGGESGRLGRMDEGTFLGLHCAWFLLHPRIISIGPLGTPL